MLINAADNLCFLKIIFFYDAAHQNSINGTILTLSFSHCRRRVVVLSPITLSSKSEELEVARVVVVWVACSQNKIESSIK